VTEEALKDIAPYLHAANVDLKAFDERSHWKNCGAHLEPVLQSIKLYKKLGIWVEIATLVIPDFNDSDESLKGIARFIRDVDPGIPWHVSRFYPAYKLRNIDPTPLDTLRKARQIGLETGLRYVYEGNVAGDGENTYCYKCGELLVERYGYQIIRNTIVDSECPKCKSKIDGIWQ
jgi:pyruvate formate lyase activating enzyme